VERDGRHPQGYGCTRAHQQEGFEVGAICKHQNTHARGTGPGRGSHQERRQD